MSKLKAIKPEEAKKRKPFILIFGEPGAKKTWESITFPNAFLADTEGGSSEDAYKKRLIKSGGMYFGPDQGSGDFDENIEQIKALATEKHSFKTYILDSLSKIYNSEITKEGERLGDKDVYGASKKPAVQRTRRLINALDKLDMTRIIICHSKALWGNDKQIGTTFDAFDKLGYELDLVLRIVRQGENSKAFVQKTRLPGFEMGGSFDWNYTEFSNKYGKEVMEEESKPIVLASKEQLKILKTLLESWRQPENFEEKTLANAKADSWSDMEADKLDKVIAFIKAKLNTTPSTTKTEK